MDTHEIAYAAGIMDGEGTFTITKAKNPGHRVGFGYFVIVSMANTDLDLMQLFKYWFGGKIHIRKKPSPDRRQGYVWYLQKAENQLKFIKILLPFLRVKRKSAEAVIEFLEGGETKYGGYNFRNVIPDEELERRERLRNEVSCLNRNGARLTMTEAA